MKIGLKLVLIISVVNLICFGMNEMASGADQINIAVNRISELTTQNHKKVDVLLQEVAKFKVD